MLAPHELKSKAFSKTLKGYSPAEVDDYIEFLIDKYTELYRENNELERKLKIVVTNFDEIRDEEEAIRSTLLKAQKLGEKIIRDANERNNIKENFKEYVKICAQHGVRLTIENDMTVEQLIPFLDEVGHGLKACFDTNNPIFYGTGYSPDMIRALGRDRIDHFHMKESRANEFGVLTRKEELVTVLGEGDSHFAEAVDAIHDIGFQGWIFAETFYFFKGFQGRDYVEIGKHTLRNLRRAYLDAQ